VAAGFASSPPVPFTGVEVIVAALLMVAGGFPRDFGLLLMGLAKGEWMEVVVMVGMKSR
jgi:hypothetical protein